MMNYLKYLSVRMNKIQNLIVFVTNRCNCKCEHCFFWKELNKPIKEITLDEFKKLADSLHKLSNISLTGGEPFIREDLPDIMRTLSNNTNRFTIPTNGILTERIISVISKATVKVNLNVSLDGLRETHNSIRGVDCFDKAVNTISKAKKLCNVTANTVISSRNCNEIEQLHEFVEELGVNHNFSIIRSKPNLLSCDWDVIRKTVKKIYRKNIKNKFFLNLKLEQLDYTINILNNKKQRNVKCLAGKHAGVIYPNGDVSVCELFKPFSNLRDYDFNFKKLWESKKADEERKKTSRCQCYHDCFLVPSLLYDPKKFVKFMIK